MATSYTYSLATDFGGDITPHQLRAEILAEGGIAATFIQITVDDDDDEVEIEFATSLSAGEKTLLDTVVSNHVSAAPPKIILGTAGTFGTTATIEASQSSNITLTLPDITDTIVSELCPQTLTGKTLEDSTTYFQDNGDNTKKAQFDASGISTATTRTLTFPDADDTIAVLAAAQTLTNKTIDADNNTLTNIDNADIKAGAAIDAAKIGNGTVSNTEFQYLNTVSSNIQTQLDAKVSADGSVGTHSDVVITSPSTAQILKYNGSNWVNDAPTPGGLTGGVALAFTTVRRSSGYALTTAFANMTFDITDVETEPTMIEHNNTNTDRIDIKKDGYYRIDYNCIHQPAATWNGIYGKLMLNDSTLIAGSESQAPGYESGNLQIIGEISKSVYAYLNNGDYITAQFKVQTACNTKFDTTLSVIKMDGVLGPTGPQGSPGDITWEGAWNSGTAYVVNEAVGHGGSSYVCISNHTNQEPPNATYWDVWNSKGDTGQIGATGAIGPTGLVNWQGAWSAQNYTVGEAVEYNGSAYICKLNTVSNEVPTNTTYWDLMAAKGEVGATGAGSTIIVKEEGTNITNTPHAQLNFIGASITAADAGNGVADITVSPTSRKCDIYYKPATETSVTLAANWVDVPLNIERTLDADFSHTANSAEITINTTDTYMIMARCSAYHTSSTRTACQFRLVRDTGGGYTQIQGTIGYLYLRGYSGNGYNTATVPLIMGLDSGDKKMQIDVMAGTTVKVASEGSGIVIRNV